MKKFILISVLLAGIFHPGYQMAQQVSQVIRGVVIDNQSKVTLPGANVILLGSAPFKGAAADAEGWFRISDVAPGRYDLKVSFMGYKDAVMSNVLVTSGKETVLEIGLEENISTLNEVVITGKEKNETLNQMTTLSARSFSMEEVNRYSGGHSDPSRLAANFAGVSTPNDARNDLVIRGNSPTGVQYRIEGLNVPNPNHFATLGTTGGPISALNPNTLDNSDFMTSAFPAEYGNANAGVFDIRFRSGNNDKPEHTVQFGMLTGLEAMSEGPVNKYKGSSYLVAGRYSFTGLAQALGINIGTAATPQYEDISFKVNTGNTRLGRWTIFGLGAMSKISFKHDKIDESDIYANPRMDSYFRSSIGAAGIKNFFRLDKKSYISTIIGISYFGNGSESDTLKENYEPFRIDQVNTREIRYSLNSGIVTKFNPRLSLKGGIQYELRDLLLYSKDRAYTPDWIIKHDFKGTTSLISAFVQVQYKITGKLVLNTGVRSQLLTLNNSWSIEPRLGLKYELNAKNSLSVGYGYNSQMQPLSVYFYRHQDPDGTFEETNRDLGFTNSHHIVAAYDVLPFSNWRIKLEAYAQFLANVPVSDTVKSFSMINEGASFGINNPSRLANNGTGTNFGVELTLEKFFSKGYYGLFTGSVYDSKYKGSDGIERNTAFNGQYVYNILAGKEFKVGNAKRHVISIDLKFTHAGGRNYTPIDLEASRAAGKEVLMGDEYAFSLRYPDFYRVDVKAGFTYNGRKKHISHTFYIDIQNVTGHRNLFAENYNPLTGTIAKFYQIGFYPNFVYKIQF